MAPPLVPMGGVTIDLGADIVDRYRAAEGQIAVALESALPVLPDGTPTQRRNINRTFRRDQQRSMEAFIERVASELDADTLDWVRKQLPTDYIGGVAKVALGTDSRAAIEWDLMHRQAVTILAADTHADLAKATAHLADSAKAFLRKAAKREVLDQVATGRASAIGRRLAKQLASEGLAAFTDATGRNWKLSTYADMVVRTKRQAAFNTGATLRMHQQGVRACLIIDGTRHDSDCTAINGKTCSVPWSLEHPLEHPQCTRTFAPLSSPPEALDYGSYDDQLPVSQLSKTTPNDQLLYAEPPTVNPARNPVRAGQPKPPPVLPAGLSADVAPATAAVMAYDDLVTQLAKQMGYSSQDVNALTSANWELIGQVWEHQDDAARKALLKGLLDEHGVELPGPKLPPTGPKPDVPVQAPGGLDPIEHDWMADATPAQWDLDQALFDQDLDAAKAAHAKLQQALQGLYAKQDALGPDAGYVLKVTLKQQEQLAQVLAKATKAIEGLEQLVDKQLAKAVATATKADDAAELAQMASQTLTPPKGSILPEPDKPRPRYQDAPKHVVDHSADWVKAIDYEEREAVRWYTGSAYHDLNDALRKGRPLSGYQQQQAERIDRALAKAGELPEPAVVWRGVRFSEASGTWQERAEWAAANFRPGDTVEWSAYSSTSTNPQIAESFGGGGILFEVEARRGVWIKHASGIASEDEFLIGRGARFEVVGVHRSVTFGQDQRTVVQLRQLP